MKTNEQLQSEVESALSLEPQLHGIVIDVDTIDGVVILHGVVDSYPKKLLAEKTAKKIAGVRIVTGELEVKLRKVDQKTDAEIASGAIQSLRWCNSVPEDAVTVSVKRGWIKIEGEVDWAYQRDELCRAIQQLTGVKGMTNLIAVKPRVNAKDISAKILSAFDRKAAIDSEGVHVEVEGAVVTLIGRVRSWSESEDAEFAAWSCPGVAKVINKLRVEDLNLGY